MSLNIINVKLLPLLKRATFFEYNIRLCTRFCWCGPVSSES